MTYPELFILRHGQSEWNASGRMQGRLDSPLTEKGRRQARRQGELLAGAGVTGAKFQFWSSPQGRARETAALALARFGVVVREDERLAEIDIGSWSGLTRDEIARAWPGSSDEGAGFLWPDAAPGGEGFPSVAARAQSFLADLDGPAVIVTHGVLSRFLRGTVLGLDFDGMQALKGGQGVVYRLGAGYQTKLS